MSLAATSLARRRAQEKIVKERRDFLKDESNATYVAQWEAQTAIRIEKQDLLYRANKFAENAACSLKKRQTKIRELYEKEELDWRVKIEILQHASKDNRIKEIREKANSLKEKREKERQDFVNLCYERQWRDGCDELRSLHSKAITDKVMINRKAAFEKFTEKKSKHSDDFKKSTQFYECNDLDENGNNDKQKRKANLETKRALDAQMEFIREQEKKCREEKRMEEEEKLSSFEKNDEFEKQKEMKARRIARVRGEQILNENTKRINEREKEMDAHKKQDLILLEYALSKERLEIQNEENQKYQGKEASREYLQFLRDQMVKEKENTASVDKIRNEEMEKIWVKRENEEKCKHEMRRKFLAEVSVSRLQQIKDKEILKKQEMEELAKQVAADQIEWKRQDEVEREESLKKRNERIQNMLENKATVEENSKLRAREKQHQRMIQNELQISEKEHSDRIAKESGNIVTNFGRRRSSMFA